MGSLGVTYENNVLDAILGPGFTKPVTVYVALFTVAPTSAGGGTEVTGGSYARATVTNDATHWPAASSSQKANGLVIAFPTATASWGTVNSFALFDAITVGVMLCFGSVTAAPVNAGVTPEFNPGQLVITAT